MAKLFASEVAVRVANECVQIHGGYGFIKDYPAEKFYRDVKLVHHRRRHQRNSEVGHCPPATWQEIIRRCVQRRRGVPKDTHAAAD